MVERDTFLEELYNEPGLEDVNPDDLFAVMMIVLGVFLVWSLVAIHPGDPGDAPLQRRAHPAHHLRGDELRYFSLLAILSAV